MSTTIKTVIQRQYNEQRQMAIMLLLVTLKFRKFTFWN